MTQQKPADGTAHDGGTAAVEAPKSAVGASAQVEASSIVARSTDAEKTEFQKTFYGSWSTAFLSGLSNDNPDNPSLRRRVVKYEGKFYFATEGVVNQVQVVTRYPAPQLLCSYKGYNLVGFRDKILAAPLVLGPLNLAQDDVRSDPRILKARTQDEATDLIDIIEASRHLGDGLVAATARVGNEALNKVRSLFSGPTLLRSYKQYNIVAFRNETLAAPLSLGHVDLNQDSAREDPRIIKGVTEDDVVRQIDALETGAQPVVPEIERDMPHLPAGIKKVNMGAGVLLRWGK